MITARCSHSAARPSGRAFSLIEAVVSVAIVGGLFVAAMNTVGASRTRQSKNAQRQRALLLAQDLMAEILQHDYWDPVSQSGMGPDASEAAIGNRSLFNDVDDYAGWSASPPQHRDGSTIDWADAYKRNVAVVWLNPNDLSQTSSTETGIKRIRVHVEYNGRELVALYAIRTEAWCDPLGD